MKRTTALVSCALVALLVAASTTTAQTTIPVTLEEDHIALEATAAEATAPVAPDVPVSAPVEAAPVPTEPEDEWTGGDTAKYLLEPLIDPLGLLVEGLIGCLILFLTLLIRKYMGVRVSEKHLAMANEIAKASWNYGEEWARERVKVEGKEPPNSVEKARVALEFGKGLATQAQLPEQLVSYIEKLIKAKLGESRG